MMHISNQPACSSFDGQLAHTVKTAIQITLIINQYDDLSLSNGGGFAASLFLHAKISRVITEKWYLNIRVEMERKK